MTPALEAPKINVGADAGDLVLSRMPTRARGHGRAVNGENERDWRERRRDTTMSRVTLTGHVEVVDIGAP
jgi:hypothetical protein